MGGDGTLIMTIGFGFSAANFLTGGVFLVATSFDSSGSQKKDNSNSDFRCTDKVETFDGEAISFDSSASGIQKKDRSGMGFVHGVTGDEMIFVGDENQSDLTC